MPPPPPPFDTWTEYVSHSTEGFKASMFNLAILARYILSGCIHNMQQDGKLKIHSILSKKEVNLPCPIALPRSNDSFDAIDAIQSRIKGRIIGQNLAIESISRSLASWEFGMDDEKDYVAKRPLNMIFTGPHGVGKYEITKQVADIMVNRCLIESFGGHLHCGNPLCNRDNSDRILHLSGMEYALDEESHGRALIQRILDHIYNQKNAGAIIIIKHVENVSVAAKLELVRLLSKRNVTFTPTNPLKDNSFGSMFGMEHDTKKVDVRLNSSIFLLTTDLGSDKIFSGLRKHIFQAPALLDAVKAEVEQDVKQYFGAEIFDVIAPFWPLQYSDMKDIASRTATITSQYKVELLDTAAECLAGPNLVDYIEMKVVGGEPFIFARGGGHDLNFGVIAKAIEDRLADDSFYHVDDVARIGYNAGEWTMQLCTYETSVKGSDGEEPVVCVDRPPLNLNL